MNEKDRAEKTILSDRHINFVFALPVTKPEGTHGLFRPGITPVGNVSRLGAPKKSTTSPPDRNLNVLDLLIHFLAIWRNVQCINVVREYSNTYPKKSLQIIKFCLSQEFLISKSSGISSFYHLKWPSQFWDKPFSGQSRLHCLGRIPST